MSIRNAFATLGAIAVAVALCYLGFIAGRMSAADGPGIDDPVKVDTLYLRDTVRVSEPLIVERRVVDTLLLTVEVPAVAETVYVQQPVEQVHYAEQMYDAWISGVSPALDSLHIYPVTQIVEVTRKVEVSRRWSLGVQGGVGVTLAGGGLHAAPYIGVGVSYNLVSW